MNKVIEPNLWGIHGGKTGDAETLFFTKHVVAPSFRPVGDLSSRRTGMRSGSS